MQSSDSDSSESSESDTPVFKKKVVFKKNKPKTQSSNQNLPESEESKIKGVAVSNINKNLKRLEQEQLHIQSQSSLVQYEQILCMDIDDTDYPNDEKEYNAWKRRELDRLHRDRNARIQREEGRI